MPDVETDAGSNDVGPCAVQPCEPRQAREGAAVSRILQVPQVNPALVPPGSTRPSNLDGWCTAFSLLLDRTVIYYIFL